MKILFTGASSFTGFWFVSELAKRGHVVHAVCRKPLDRYEGLRKKRLELLLPLCQIHFSVDIGSDAWRKMIERESPFDLFCHHAADTKNYRSPSFDCALAVANNARGSGETLQQLLQNGCKQLLLTGSFFESGEGGSGSKTFTPYGLSKTLTYQIFLFHAERLGVKLKKFVIPNPFGPYEEDRFTSYLIDCWKKGKEALVKAPDYLRDNIPAPPLASAYADFAMRSLSERSIEIFRPSGYIETIGSFTKRVADEMGPRLGRSCPFILEKNPCYTEPMEIKNSDFILQDWEEKDFWDRLAEFYS
ncbi:MAG: NAD(P)-dependent oxidoreductase [Chlamydiae bacterium]|nr:NAD(P)-dependent oxidoreductase [Chlamydiota bacterium]